MANIFDYLDWRGDMPLSADPLNEVDNLVLSELVYTDFREIVPEDGREISLQEACTEFFRRHTREEVLADKTFTGKAPLLMEMMVNRARFQDMTLSWYVDEIDVEKEFQLAAVTFRFPDGSAYIAFRGTDGTVVGWKEDFNLTFLSRTPGQMGAIAYLNRVGHALSGPLTVGGHSKGGNLAVYASAFCDPDIQDRIRTVYSNDGPGFRQEITEDSGYERMLGKMISIVPDTSIIGLLLSSRASHRVIESTASGIFQHDGFSWSVHRNRFAPAQLSAVSELIDQVLGSWLAQMDDETRESAIDTVFSLFEATGKETFGEINGQKLKSAEAILTALRSLPREKQQEVLRLFGLLGQSGGHATISFLSAFLNERKEEKAKEEKA